MAPDQSVNSGELALDDGRRALRADCSQCFGLCCVAPAFARSSDFAIDKPAGHPCPNLAETDACTIHEQLRDRGFAGCTVFDCLGAGQKVAQQTFGGHSWRETPAQATLMFEVFQVMRQLHELLWYLTEALSWPAARSVHPEVRETLDQTEALTRQTPEVLVDLDLAALHDRANVLLLRASELVRGRRRGPNRRGADLIGKDLRRTDLRRANLRGAYLIGANLSGSDLALADLIGADLRGADVRGAALHDSLFLTQMQLDAARGDAGTTIPPALRRPLHWQL